MTWPRTSPRNVAALRASIRTLMLIWAWWWLGAASLLGQSTNSSLAGFQRISGKYVDVITDLPLDDELRQLPAVFDAAMPIWCEVFDVQPAETGDWRGQVYIMLERKRFQQAGLIPDHLPDFPYGFQYGNQMWVSEQPSAYYRRHLMLHEGTHWFMNRKYGRNGPPWLMEGMAEWLGTHRWHPATQTLDMGIVPEDKRKFPFWGRISMIQEQLSNQVAPSLETILRYDDSAHRHVDAYAWSWAAVLFLQNHPETRETFQELLKRPMRSDKTLTRWLYGRLRDDWPFLRQSWTAMISDLEYGFDPARSLVSVTRTPRRLGEQTVTLELETDRGWQPSGIYVEQGDRITVAAEGSFTVGQSSGAWTCYADGVTLEYHHGQPLGKLMLGVLSPMSPEPAFSQTVKTLPIGARRELAAAASGELHFRINETSGDLHDNEGRLTIRLSR